MSDSMFRRWISEKLTGKADCHSIKAPFVCAGCHYIWDSIPRYQAHIQYCLLDRYAVRTYAKQTRADYVDETYRKQTLDSSALAVYGTDSRMVSGKATIAYEKRAVETLPIVTFTALWQDNQQNMAIIHMHIRLKRLSLVSLPPETQ